MDRELGHKPRYEIKLSREQVMNVKGGDLRERESTGSWSLTGPVELREKKEELKVKLG